MMGLTDIKQKEKYMTEYVLGKQNARQTYKYINNNSSLLNKGTFAYHDNECREWECRLLGEQTDEARSVSCIKYANEIWEEKLLNDEIGD